MVGSNDKVLFQPNALWINRQCISTLCITLGKVALFVFLVGTGTKLGVMAAMSDYFFCLHDSSLSHQIFLAIIGDSINSVMLHPATLYEIDYLHIV